MGLPRIIQLLGFLIVSFVMIRSYMIDSMAFQFGGLAIGAIVFLFGKGLEKQGGAA